MDFAGENDPVALRGYGDKLQEEAARLLGGAADACVFLALRVAACAERDVRALIRWNDLFNRTLGFFGLYRHDGLRDRQLAVQIGLFEDELRLRRRGCQQRRDEPYHAVRPSHPVRILSVGFDYTKGGLFVRIRRE